LAQVFKVSKLSLWRVPGDVALASEVRCCSRSTGSFI